MEQYTVDYFIKKIEKQIETYKNTYYGPERSIDEIIDFCTSNVLDSFVHCRLDDEICFPNLVRCEVIINMLRARDKIKELYD